MTLKPPRDLNAALGARIRQRRRMLGLSQDALAEAAGVTFQQIQKYEVGGNGVPFSRLVAIAARLNLRLADLAEGLDSPSDGSAEEAALGRLFAAEGSRDLLLAYGELPGAHRRAVREFVRTLADTMRGRRPA